VVTWLLEKRVIYKIGGDTVRQKGAGAVQYGLKNELLLQSLFL